MDAPPATTTAVTTAEMIPSVQGEREAATRNVCLNVSFGMPRTSSVQVPVTMTGEELRAKLSVADDNSTVSLCVLVPIERGMTLAQLGIADNDRIIVTNSMRARGFNPRSPPPPPPPQSSSLPFPQPPRGRPDSPTHGHHSLSPCGFHAPQQWQEKAFVGNIPLGTTEDQLVMHFRQFNPAKAEIIPLKPGDHWFGFVFFSNKQDRDTAITHLNRTFLGGRKLHVDLPH